MSVRTLSQQKLSLNYYAKIKPPLPKGSVYFDGSGDYLTVASNTAFSFPSDFTVEFWMNLSNVSSSIYAALVDFRGNGTNGPYIYLGLDNGNLILYANYAVQIRSAALNANQWYHVALVRSGTTTTMYMNGTSAGSITSDTTSYGNNGLGIGVNTQVTSQTITGYLSNLRLQKGLAAYTAAFTTPSSPLAATSTTNLLTCNSPTSIADSSTNNFTITAYGNAAASSTSPF